MKWFLALIAAGVLILATPFLAYAESLSWTGGPGIGSDVLPCTDGGHWVLSGAQAVNSATLVVGGGTYAMQPDGSGAFTADSSGPIVIGDVAVVTYDGGGQPSVSLAACVAASPSPTPDPSPTPSPSDSPPPPSSPPPGSPGHPGGSGGTGGTGGGGTGRTGGTGSSGGSPVLHGGGNGASAATGTTHTAASRKALRHVAAVHGPLPAAIHRALTTDPSSAADPPHAAVGAADGAVQQAWNDGGAAEPFQDARRPQRALVIAVIAVVALGVVGAFAARRHLIHATT